MSNNTRSKFSNIVLTNRDQTTKSNVFTYRFPSTQSLKNHRVSLSGATFYNQWFNIRSSIGNNSIKFTWNALVPTEHTIIFEDGFYHISDLNSKFQSYCLLNHLYLNDNKDNAVYFAEIKENSIQYSAQLNFYPIFTEAEANQMQYTLPEDATWSFPSVKTTPQIEITNIEFGNLIGFNLGIFPPTPLNANQQYKGTKTPYISPISTIFILCTLVNNEYVNPSTYMANTKINSTYGDTVEYKPNFLVFQDVVKGNYNELTITLLSNYYEDITIRDNDCVFELTLQEFPNEK